MEYENSDAALKYEFLYDKKASACFAKIDYALRNGVHIQRDYPLSGEVFRFLTKYFESLKDYYEDLFRVALTEDGSDFNKYYYLDMEEGSRNNIASEYREYLKTEYIIIGMLFFKMIRIDGNLELDSIKDFLALLYMEYEEEKVSLRRLITDVASDKGSDVNDTKFEETIRKAFTKFGELGWIMWENDIEKNRFRTLPSFERLRRMYNEQIENIDNIIKGTHDAG